MHKRHIYKHADLLYILDSIIKTFLSRTLFVTFFKCWHAYKSTFQKIEKRTKVFFFVAIVSIVIHTVKKRKSTKNLMTFRKFCQFKNVELTQKHNVYAFKLCLLNMC